MATGGSECFISDLHLSAHEPAIVAHFLAFLEGPARQADRLTILGDLFDSWAGDDDLADPFNTRIAAALRQLAEHGVAIDLMVGNRDFLVGPNFAAAAGVTLLNDPVIRSIGGIQTLLTHGDTLCTDDIDYQRFRTHIRSSGWQSQFLARPLAERKREIEALRLRSEAEKRGKPQGIMDANPTAVLDAMRRHGAGALIHGHTHRQGCHAHETGTRWVLGDWRPGKASILACDHGGWRWQEKTENFRLHSLLS